MYTIYVSMQALSIKKLTKIYPNGNHALKGKLLILDEPTAGVDVEIRRSMWEFLRRINSEGTTIILTTHYLEEAERLCRHLAIIDEGEIIENTRMSIVLRKLQREIFLLSLADPLTETPKILGFEIKLNDPFELEVAIDAEHDLNTLFAILSEQGITAVSLRNKANRLEELFMGIVENKQDNSSSAVASSS